MEINRHTQTWYKYIRMHRDTHTQSQGTPNLQAEPTFKFIQGAGLSAVRVNNLSRRLLWPPVSPRKVTVETRERAVALNSRHRGMTAV